MPSYASHLRDQMGRAQIHEYAAPNDAAQRGRTQGRMSARLRPQLRVKGESRA